MVNNLQVLIKSRGERKSRFGGEVSLCGPIPARKSSRVISRKPTNRRHNVEQNPKRTLVKSVLTKRFTKRNIAKRKKADPFGNGNPRSRRIQVTTKRELEAASSENSQTRSVKRRKVSLTRRGTERIEKMTIEVEQPRTKVLSSRTNTTKRNVRRRAKSACVTTNKGISKRDVRRMTSGSLQIIKMRSKSYPQSPPHPSKGPSVVNFPTEESSSARLTKRVAPSATSRNEKTTVRKSSLTLYSSDDTESSYPVPGSKKSVRPVSTVTKEGHIMLRNLPQEVNARMLMKELFINDDQVIKAVVHTNENGGSLGTGEVIFTKPKYAHNAIVRHKGLIWRGSKIKLSIVKEMIEDTSVDKVSSRHERRQLDSALRKSTRFQEVAALSPSRTSIPKDKYLAESKSQACSEEKFREGHGQGKQYETSKLSEENLLKRSVESPATVRVASTRRGWRPHGFLPKSTNKLKQNEFEYIPKDEDDGSTSFHVTLKKSEHFACLDEKSD